VDCQARAEAKPEVLALKTSSQITASGHFT
jgi:hypothetical protein